MAEFQIVLIEGLFYNRDGDLFVEQDNGEHRSVLTTLLPLVGQRVQFAIHHLPPHGIQAGEPGAGACKFPGGKGCPVGHDVHPDRLLGFHLDGVLQNNPSWGLTKFDGTVAPIPFAGMDGHYGRVAAATIVDVEAMRESLLKAAVSPSSDSSGLNVQDLEALLTRLRRGMSH